MSDFSTSAFQLGLKPLPHTKGHLSGPLIFVFSRRISGVSAPLKIYVQDLGFTRIWCGHELPINTSPLDFEVLRGCPLSSACHAVVRACGMKAGPLPSDLCPLGERARQGLRFRRPAETIFNPGRRKIIPRMTLMTRIFPDQLPASATRNSRFFINLETMKPGRRGSICTGKQERNKQGDFE
jgi:hypothetical protein